MKKTEAGAIVHSDGQIALTRRRFMGACGIGLGTWMVALTGFKNATYAFTLFGLTIPAYAAIYGLVVNIVVALVATVVFNAIRGAAETRDNTVAADYL